MAKRLVKFLYLRAKEFKIGKKVNFQRPLSVTLVPSVHPKINLLINTESVFVNFVYKAAKAGLNFKPSTAKNSKFSTENFESSSH